MGSARRLSRTSALACAWLASAACRPSGPPAKGGTSFSPGGGGVSGGGSPTGGASDGGSATTGGGGSYASCPGSWFGGTSSFRTPSPLSADPGSTLAGLAFLQSGPVALVAEPQTPDLRALWVGSSPPRAQRLDSAGLPFSGDVASVQLFTALDGSAALVWFPVSQGDSAGSALALITPAGAGSPLGFAGSGLTASFGVAGLARSGGAELLGYDPSGLPLLVEIGAGPSYAARLPAPAGVTSAPGARAPVLWDDQHGSFVGLAPVPSQGGGLALFALRGAAFTRIDVDAPEEAQGALLALGPGGELGALVEEGSGAPELAGYVLDGAGLSGGRITQLSAPLALPGTPSAPWGGPCLGIQATGCDPFLRFEPAAGGAPSLAVAFTTPSGLELSRLAPSAGASWSTPAAVANGPLVSPLALGPGGSLLGLEAPPTGLSFIDLDGGTASVAPVPPGSGAFPALFVAAGPGGGGALWGGAPGSSTIASWTFEGASIAAGPTATLSGGEQPATLEFAATEPPSSAGAPYFAVAEPGWLLLGGALAGQGGGARDLLLAAADPATGALAGLTSIAAAGWQQGAGASPVALLVDGQGVALVVFTQASAGSTLDYVVHAAPGGVPTAPCSPVPAGAWRFFADVKPLPGYPSSGTLVFGRDGPATVVIAK